MPVTTTSQRSAPGGYSAPVVHLHQPQAAPPPQWQGLAIAGALAMQFLLVALIALKTLVPVGSTADQDKIAAALADLKEAQQELAIAEARLQSQRETMDRAVAALAPGESFTALQEKVDLAARLERDVEARENEYLQLKDTLAKADQALKKSTSAQDDLTHQITSLKADNKELTETLKATEAKLAVYEPKKKAADGKTETAGGTGAISIWWWVGGGVLAAVVLVAGVWWLGERRNNDEGSENAETQDKSKRSEAKKDGNSDAGN